MRFYFVSALLIGLLFMNSDLAAFQQFTPPATPQNLVVEKIHGIEITDPYRWLEDKNNPGVQDWTKKQHQATLQYLQQTAPDVPGLNQEIAALLDRDIITPPRFKKGREFFYKKMKGELQLKLYTRLQDKEIVIFDPVELDATGKTSISAFVLNQDASLAAIGTQSKGAEITDYRIIDTRTGKQQGDILQGISGFSWSRRPGYAFITPRTLKLINEQKPLAVYLHKLGQDISTAQKMLEPQDAKISAWIYEDEYEDVQIWGQGDFYSNTVKFRALNDNNPPQEIYSSKEFKANPEFRNGNIYWLTNDHAPNFKIMVSDVKKPAFADARVLIPEGKNVIDDYEITNKWLLVKDKKDVLSRILVYDHQGTFVRELELPELGNVSSMSYDRDLNIVYVTLSTFTSPSRMYTLDGNTLKWNFYFQEKIPVDLSDIVAEIKFFSSRDGARIPMFIVHRKDIQFNGNNPVLITGYGGFNIGISPYFVGYNASFLRRGGVFVHVGLRGGNEYGEQWHRDGMLKRKQNTFDDFIAATEWLIENKYANPQSIIARGGSNGGLLMGAIATQRPDLYRAVICQVPLLDMLRYHKFQIARYWIPEYGDPDNAADFGTLLKYSPYHCMRMNIPLPEMLITVGENDTRVDPLHGKKFAALAQSRPEQKSPVMLYVDYDSGHGSGKSVTQQIEDQAFVWRYIFSRLNIK
jgi:prolyl oligopeptidase